MLVAALHVIVFAGILLQIVVVAQALQQRAVLFDPGPVKLPLPVQGVDLPLDLHRMQKVPPHHEQRDDDDDRRRYRGGGSGGNSSGGGSYGGGSSGGGGASGNW